MGVWDSEKHKILELRDRGLTLDQIGAIYGVSGQRIRQLLEKFRFEVLREEVAQTPQFNVVDFIGYRIETAYGSGVRGVEEVIRHEFEELGNTDILEYSGISSDGIDELVGRLHDLGFTECVWLCRDVTDLEMYLSQGEEAAADLYMISGGIILSDLGSDGVLVAYRPGTVLVEKDKSVIKST